MGFFRTWWPLAAALVLNAFGNILMKVGSKLAQQNPLALQAGFVDKVFHFFNAATIIGIILFAANVLMYRKALDNIDISVAYPVMVSLGLVLVTVAAVWWPVLNEKVTLVQIIGMFIICVGVWLVVKRDFSVN